MNFKKRKVEHLFPLIIYNDNIYKYIKNMFICFFFKWIQNKVLIAKLSINWYNFFKLSKKGGVTHLPRSGVCYKTELRYARGNNKWWCGLQRDCVTSLFGGLFTICIILWIYIICREFNKHTVYTFLRSRGMY